MRYKTCAFFGPDFLEVDGVGIYTRWTIEGFIEKYEVSRFLFGSGGDFERVCYQYIKESKQRNKHLELEAIACESVFDLERMIDKCDLCIFSDMLFNNRRYFCEGVEIGLVSNKLMYLHEYAKAQNKKILYI